MAWLDAAGIRGKFNIAASRFDTQIAAAIASAALVLQRGADADIYAEAINETAPTDPTELLRYNSVVDAHSFLTMYFLVGNVGNRLSEAGFVKSQQDAGSPAMQGRVVTNSYLTPKEINDLKAGYLANAKASLGVYGVIDIDDDIDSNFSIVSGKWF